MTAPKCYEEAVLEKGNKGGTAARSAQVEPLPATDLSLLCIYLFSETQFKRVTFPQSLSSSTSALEPQEATAPSSSESVLSPSEVPGERELTTPGPWSLSLLGSDCIVPLLLVCGFG